jgi:uncharacterized beta-barrel protein YwiB (DUF1934 family)
MKFVIILSKKGEKMKNSKITITTTIDNQSTETVRAGQALLTPFNARAVYNESNAQVVISLEDGVLRIVRTGDYTQTLLFKNGETLEGSLGIGGAEGVIYTKTHKLAFSLSDTSMLLSLHYSLLIGDEPQDVKIRMFIKTIDE